MSCCFRSFGLRFQLLSVDSTPCALTHPLLLASCNLQLAFSVFAQMTNAQMKNQTVRLFEAAGLAQSVSVKQTDPPLPLLYSSCSYTGVSFALPVSCRPSRLPRLACHNINNKAICQLRMFNFACVATNRSSLLSSLIFNEFTPSNSCA